MLSVWCSFATLTQCSHAIVCNLPQVWLDAYHGQHIDSSAFGRSGLLQQALVLEMNNNKFNALQVKTLGWNGQLPMLDLYFLIKRLTENGPGLQLSQAGTLHSANERHGPKAQKRCHNLHVQSDNCLSCCFHQLSWSLILHTCFLSVSCTQCCHIDNKS